MPLDKGRPIDLWIGSAPSTDRTVVEFAWEALGQAQEKGAAALEIEPVSVGSGASLGAPQTIAAAGANATSVARFLLEPGTVSVKMTMRASDGAEVDRWTDRIVVPDYADGGIELGTPRVYRTRSVLEARRFDSGAVSTPTVSRRFSRTVRLVIDVPWASVSRAPDVGARHRSRRHIAHVGPVSTDALCIMLQLANLARASRRARRRAAGEEREPPASCSDDHGGKSTSRSTAHVRPPFRAVSGRRRPNVSIY